MRIFTEKGFQQELYRRQQAKEEADYINRRFTQIEERIERLYMMISEIKGNQGTCERVER